MFTVMRHFRFMVTLFLILLLMGCAAPNAPAPPPQSHSVYVNGASIVRYIDEEAGVVCWVAKFYKGGGVSCLPIDDTLLPFEPGGR